MDCTGSFNQQEQSSQGQQREQEAPPPTTTYDHQPAHQPQLHPQAQYNPVQYAPMDMPYYSQGPQVPAYSTQGAEQYYGADGSLPGTSNAPYEASAGRGLEQMEEGVEMEEREIDVSSRGEETSNDDEKNELDLGSIPVESLEDLFENNPNDMSFVDILFEGVLAAEREAAREEVKEEEELEIIEEEEQEQEEAEAARRMEQLKKLAEEEEKSMQLIRQIQRQDQMENRMRTLRNRGRLENPKRKPSADKEKLREEAKGHDLFKFKPGTSNDPNNPEIDRILLSLGKTRMETRPEERRRRRPATLDSESEDDDENYDPDESRWSRRKQQAKRRETNNGKKH